MLKVIDHANVPQRQIASALDAVRDVYGAAGIDLKWTVNEEPAQGAVTNAQVTVEILSGPMQEHKCEVDGLGPAVFGTATHVTRKAYVFYQRIEEHARNKGSDPKWMLGGVVTHEVGHLLLGPNSHSPSGVMRAQWRGRISAVPGFSSKQGAALRRQLMSESRAPS